MDTYNIWVNLKDSRQDLEFARAVHAYLGHLRDKGFIAGFRLTRRKFGFSPPTLAEFHIAIDAHNLAQLDDAFNHVATRDPEIERLHRPVYSMVTDFTSALYRDFPDPQRSASLAQPPTPA